MYRKQKQQSDGFYVDLDIHQIDSISCFFTNASTQFPQTPNGRFFSIELVAVERQQQVGDQSRQQLEQHSMTIPADEMIHFQMTFPPTEELLDLPTERVNECYLLCGEVCSVSSNPEDFLPNTKSHKIHRMLHPMVLVTQQHLGKEKHFAILVEGEFFQNFPLGVILQTCHEMLFFIYPFIESGVVFPEISIAFLKFL